ncbi:cupin domain protein [Talaromyces proteolyticus]|uniref:Cupin domain protein n=1 Tax=Talaromyces proteolyticus TaxID=1131652 RepID=A0AAD4KXJ8_9EURO|nr:cupin domain protein [Talaromyces proteolyticus]KAH8699007.1 cupin domain protein [Talaromyces proteolyticus]
MSAGRIQPKPLRRIITTHDAASGRAIFSDAVGEQVSFTGFPVPPGKPTTSDYALAYNTSTFPVQGLSPPTSAVPESKANLDIKHYHSQLSDPSPLNPPNGTSCTIIEVPPGSVVPMHRTATLDYGVIIDGTTELVLDSGVKKLLSKGDVFVQRGTAHSWRNVTEKNENSGVLRVFFVFQPIEQVRLEGGKVIGQDLTLSLHEA